MPSYKLHYFDMGGRAEACRLIFAMAGVDYEDKRYTYEEWLALKATGKFMFGTMPVLEVDGYILAQSNAISRYLANEYGFMGKNNFENAKIDMIVDAVADVITAFVNYYFQEDKAKMAEFKEVFVSQKIPTAFAAFEKILIANNGGDGYFVGEGISLADVTFVSNYDMVLTATTTSLDSYPKLKAMRDRVLALPKIAEWVKKRPESEF